MHPTEPMPSGQYSDYTAQNHYASGSPDTFYEPITVQPPTATHSASDSANTPSSSAPKSRRTVARPSQSQSTHSNQRNTLDSIEFSSSFRGPSTQVRKERERQLANTPREALIQLAIKREYESKKAKQLLTTAVLQLEVVKEHLSREEEARKELEEEKHMHGVKTTQTVLKAQMDSMNVTKKLEHTSYRWRTCNANCNVPKRLCARSRTNETRQNGRLSVQELTPGK
ncbi:hypothetical protein BJ912DRAFT_540103 [Pholiota molesta]|nr:hypothetical protein BJ912DRAFT_540103 [Pholiota molesta]